MFNTGTASELGPTEGKVIVAGAGIGGLACAVALHKVGIPVLVLERYGEIRSEGAALGVSTNAWRVLEQLDVGDELRAGHRPIERAVMVRGDGKRLASVDIKTCDGGPHELRSVRRARLQDCLAAKLPPGTIHFNKAIDSVSETDSGAVVTLKDGTALPARVVIGADGNRSKVAASLGFGPLRYSGVAAFRGIADIKEGAPDDVGHEFHQIFESNGRAGGVMRPDPDTLYYFLVYQVPEKEPLPKGEAAKQKALQLFQNFPDRMKEIIEGTDAHNLYLNHLYDRPVKIGEPYGKGTITVIGDAAHPTNPTLAQGACMAMEDGSELAAALRDACKERGWAATPKKDLAAALRAFEAERTRRTGPMVHRARRIVQLMQLPLGPLGVWLRNRMVPRRFVPSEYYKHAVWKPSSLATKLTDPPPAKEP